MNESEFSILNDLINRKIQGFSMARSYFELNKNSEIKCFGELLLSFEDQRSNNNVHYVGIDPRPSGGPGDKLYFLTQWKYVHKPLSERMYFPSQNMDSKFKSGFGCSFFGSVQNLSLHKFSGNSGLLRLNFENGSMNIIIRDQCIEVNLDSSKSLKDIFDHCFDSEKGTKLLSI